MDATYRAEQLENARREAAEARAAYHAAKPGKVKRDAAESLEFWTNKVAFLACAK